MLWGSLTVWPIADNKEGVPPRQRTIMGIGGVCVIARVGGPTPLVVSLDLNESKRNI